MRQDILEYLLEHKGQYVSGQKISELFGISRTAVWKHIHVLKQRGYIIDSFTKKGYCLQQAPELLNVEELKEELGDYLLGNTLYYYEKVDSTNNICKRFGMTDAPEGTVVIAEKQTGGRGRLERTFLSPFAKGLWFSVLFRPPFAPMESSKMTLLAAVAVANAIKKNGLSCQIKWPNDILVDSKKLVGILTELNASMESINYLVMGIGVNTNISKKELPRDLKKIVTSFEIEDVSVNRTELLKEILGQLERYYDMAKTVGFGPILEEWRTLSGMLHKNVEVISHNTEYEGKAVDIDEDGNLLVETDQGIKKVIAGDVRVRTKE